MRLWKGKGGWKIWRKVLVLSGLAMMVGFAISYSNFVRTVHFAVPSSPTEKADGIVVLTGDAHRIAEGVKRLQSNQARRMLISGVGAHTSRQDLAGIAGQSVLSPTCCIDLDREALNTKGNAIHAARWARTNGFRSLIIVTSDYHMPRSLYLMRQRMPEVEIVPVPVRSHEMDMNSVFLRAFSPQVIREYMKYVAVTLGVEPSASIVVSTLSGKTSI